MGSLRQPHSHTLRLGRVSLPGHYYLLTTITLNRKPLFHNLFAGRSVALELNRARARTLAYVIMPDHFHWLIQLEDIPLPRLMQVMKSRSAIAVNKLLQRTGAVWQDGYHDHALRRDEDVRKVAHYLIANPLRAHLVADIGDYPLWDTAWI